MSWQMKDKSTRTGNKRVQTRDQTTIASMQITEQEKSARDRKSAKLKELRASAPIRMAGPAEAKATKGKR